MFSFSLSFSKPRIISIVLLLAILVISLLFTSYTEGMASTSNATTSDKTATDATTSDAIKSVNKDAPKAKSSDVTGPFANTPLTTDSVKPSEAISLGTLSVSDITGVLQNNPGVQKMINNKL